MKSLKGFFIQKVGLKNKKWDIGWFVKHYCKINKVVLYLFFIFFER